MNTQQPAIYVEITRTRGSAPRDAGTAMRVTGQGTQGTIGGGALEYRAIATARRMLRDGTPALDETIPLGPDLGQCCGGVVRLHYADTPMCLGAAPTLPALPPPRPDTAAVPLWIWGAGHVGRAMVRHMAPLEAFDIVWVDTDAERFPHQIPATVEVLPATDMPRLAEHAPPAAWHLILTYSHDIDLALCATLLGRGTGWCGLIGSATKKVRFFKRLRALGLDPATITCPIGDPRRGKHPDQIAHSTAVQLLHLLPNTKDTALAQRTSA